jgi:Tol biopolymer transport system component
MNADGSEQRRLTDMVSMESGPVWSPDGTMLAFLSHDLQSNGSTLFVMNADGSDQRAIHRGATSRPEWSPDGRWIVVSSFVEDVQRDQIVVVAVDGSGATRLTSHENVPTAGLSMGNVDPVWSPDGSQIAFAALQSDGPSEIHVINPDGSTVQRLTDSPTGKQRPVWSPDGTRIAFTTDFPDPEVWVMNADGTDQRNLSNDPMAIDIAPSWSPDGSIIAFVSQADSGNQIMLVNADGSDLHGITALPGVAERLDWSPDGTRIAFSPFNESGNRGIIVVSADGSEFRQLTDAATGDGDPAWSPDGTQIAFVSTRDGGQPVQCSWSTIADMAFVESVEALTWMSHIIVAGTIVEDIGPAFGSSGHRDSDGDWTIYHDYVLDVERQFRGAPVETLRLRVEGGTIGDCVQTYDPSVSLSSEMRVLVFLDAARDDEKLGPAHFVSVIGTWVVGPGDTVTSPEPIYNPEGVDGMTLDEVGAAVAEALSNPPPENAFYVVTLEESPATPQ